jgi:hypothetical protein
VGTAPNRRPQRRLSPWGQRRDLALENLALRHQLTVLKRQSKKPQLEDRDRLFWIVETGLYPPSPPSRYIVARKS